MTRPLRIQEEKVLRRIEVLLELISECKFRREASPLLVEQLGEMRLFAAKLERDARTLQQSVEDQS